MIPLYIISYNRLDPLQQLLKRIENWNLDITIVDNNSTYEPLLDFYEDTCYYVKRLPENLGHHAPWLAGLIEEHTPYLVTDPDVVPIDEMELDAFLPLVSHIFARYPNTIKVGLGLKTWDLPDCYNQKENVIKWENQFRKNAISAPQGVGLFSAPVDTTFAMYQPDTKPDIAPAIRTGYPFLARHLAWYSDSTNPTPEEVYYKDHLEGRIASWVYDDLLDPVLKAQIS